MKITWINILLLLIPFLLSAQRDQTDQLREELKTLEGTAFIEKAIILSDEFYRQRRFQEAAGAAAHAYRIANQVNDKEAMAIALNREGKAMLRQRKQAGKRAKIALKFQDSNKLLEQTGSTNDALRLDNLSQLKKMAKQLNRTKDVNELEKQIRELQASSNNGLKKDTFQAVGDLLEYVDEKTLTPRQRRALNKLKGINFKEQESDQRILKTIEQAKAELEEETAKLNMDKEQLNEGLIAQQEAIAKMTAEQMQNELMLTKIKKQSDYLLYVQELDSISLAQKDAELSETEAILEKQKAQRWLYFAIIAGILFLAISLYSRYRSQKKNNTMLAEKNEIIEKEKDRSDSLLLNILPATIADELKTNGKAKARHHANVSVLFTDFVNFSGIAEQLSPEELVEQLDHCFKAFDEIITKYGLEKIKTIGDAYMCAGGLTKKQENHAEQMIKAALEIQQFLNTWKKEKGELFFEARIGIHTGPIVAGVVGLKKFAYDIWGDTVNVAARLESKGAAGKVNISGDTYQLIKSHFDCEYRGKVAAKNKGEIDMYYVNMWRCGDVEM